MFAVFIFGDLFCTAVVWNVSQAETEVAIHARNVLMQGSGGDVNEKVIAGVESPDRARGMGMPKSLVHAGVVRRSWVRGKPSTLIAMGFLRCDMSPPCGVPLVCVLSTYYC